MPTATVVRDAPRRIAPSVVPGLDLFAGRFDAACTVCGRRPCTLLLRDALPGDGPGGPAASVAHYFYCQAHEPAADLLYEALAAA